MTRTRRPSRRAAWAVPAAVTALAVGVPLAVTASADAAEHPVLPTLTAAQLLADVATSRQSALSGTVQETARLGLPTLPGGRESGAFGWQSLVTGTHRARLWVDGPQRQRIAVLGQLAEADLVHNGREVWTWASDTRQVTHVVLSQAAEHGTAEQQAEHGTAEQQAAGTLSPLQAAQQAVAAITPSTRVSVQRTEVVAGRPAYTLVLEPRTTGSTVRKVAIAIDSASHVPLRVQVYGAADQPALEAAFTSIDLSRPAAGVFRFTPPAGARVTTRQLDGTQDGTHRQAAPSRLAPAAGAPADRPLAGRPQVVGSGWTSVLVTKAPTGAAAEQALSRFTTPAAGGGRLLRTALVNALLTSDGRLLVGAVTPAVLEQAAG